jgi:hypothetical protein
MSPRFLRILKSPVLGFLTLCPAIGLINLAVVARTIFLKVQIASREESTIYMQQGQWAALGFAIGMLIGYAILIAYLIHARNASWYSADEKRNWTVILVYLMPIGLPVYWWALRRRSSRESG